MGGVSSSEFNEAMDKIDAQIAEMSGVFTHTHVST